VRNSDRNRISTNESFAMRQSTTVSAFNNLKSLQIIFDLLHVDMMLRGVIMHYVTKRRATTGADIQDGNQDRRHQVYCCD